MRVVEEVVLELVEDDQHRAAESRRPLGEDVREPTGGGRSGPRRMRSTACWTASFKAATGRSLLHDGGNATGSGLARVARFDAASTGL